MVVVVVVVGAWGRGDLLRRVEDEEKRRQIHSVTRTNLSTKPESKLKLQLHK